MRALDSEVVDAVWAAVEPRVPVPVDDHPTGGHRPRIADRVCFQGLLIRLVTGCSWVTAERLLGQQVSDTTLRARRDEWVAAGVFDELAAEAVEAYDRIVGLDLTEVAVDGSQHKAPCGGPGTGRNPTDRGKSGWKWSLFCDRDGIPVGWAADGANRCDQMLFAPTLDAAAGRGLLADVETLHLDRGYDSAPVQRACTAAGIDDVLCARRRPPGAAGGKTTAPLGMRWPVERTNSQLSNFG
ncbi:MAG: IS5 family transposase, partial [bacterium]|nr:IS5 family transposase [bacterium]